MSQMKQTFGGFHVGRILGFTLVGFTIFVAGSFKLVPAQQAGQKTFASCEQASTALFAAVESGDVPTLLQILGPAGSGYCRPRPNIEPV